MTLATERFSQLVVIGSSAGGIEALSTVLGSLTQGFSAPIVIAQHIDPNRPSHLADILSRRTPLAVHTIAESQELQAGAVFVVPANRNVEITDHVVALRDGQAGPPRPSVDLLLSSAAAAYGEGLIAVILSGTGSDGAVGAHHVKQHGGTVIIENPETAHYPGMPQSLSPMTVDIVADLDKIGPVLADLLASDREPPPSDAQPTLERFLEELRQRSGIDFNSYKRPTIQRRLQRRMAATNTHRLEDYVAYLQFHPEEYQRLVNSFLIKVTEFFRDAELFSQLQERILPDIVERARRRGNDIRIWSAGCATGEEAYSLGIALSETLGDQLDQFQVRIFATDVDDEAVVFARRGVYQAGALANLPPELVNKYFSENHGEFEINKRLRVLTVFGQHDLGQRAPFPQIDLILCRNVLIYFTAELQKRALQLFAFSLRDNGYLVLGKAETTSPLAEFFVAENQGLKIYRRHGERLLIPPPRAKEGARVPAPPAFVPRRPPPSAGIAQQPPSSLGGQRLDDVFLRLPVGVVVVNHEYDIQSINSAARRLLGIHGGAIGEDLIHLAQTLPARQLRTLIDAALRDRTVQSLSELELPQNAAGPCFVDVTCHPRTGQVGDEGSVVVVVVDVTARVQEQRRLQGQASTAETERSRLATQVDRLLAANQELLQANEDLTAANMELRSTNEEFLVDNEEVQAATEEVETLNEELQATNEELETLNEELQATVEELNTTNDDLEARSLELQEAATAREAQHRQLEEEKERLDVILASVGSALLVVDSRGRTILTNAAFQDMFGPAGADLRPEDSEGQPLPEHQTPQRRAASGESFHMDFIVTDAAGQRRWYEAIGNPLGARTNSDGVPTGGVLAIRDVTDRGMRQLQDEFLGVVSHELRTPLTALEGFLQLVERSLESDGGDERSKHNVDMARQQARRLDVLINDLVDLTRLQTGKLTLHLEEVDLVALAHGIVEVAQTLAGSHSIEAHIPDGPLIARADAGRIEQVLLNLVNNAIAHTAPAAHIEIHLRKQSQRAEFQVRDWGPGIAQEELPKLFARFYQGPYVPTQASGQPGLGLGLFIAHEFVIAHGGTIEVASKLGEGTTFTVQLPLAGPA